MNRSRYWKWPHGPVTLKMAIDRYENERYYVTYTFKFDGKTLFSGNDLGVSPLHEPLGEASRLALLTFLTLKPGDTDAEYFQNYTSGYRIGKKG